MAVRIAAVISGARTAAASGAFVNSMANTWLSSDGGGAGAA